MEEVLKYLSVYALSGVKFIFGPTLGITYGLSILTTSVLTACGMMTTVFIVTYFGDDLRALSQRFRRRQRKLFSKKNRRFVKIWKKYGVKGIALVTPVLLMPIGGAILVNVLGGKKQSIMLWMWVSALVHAFVQTWLFKGGLDYVKSLL